MKQIDALIAPRSKLSDVLSTIISAQHKSIKLDNILIIGESGTGKSHTLNAIKNISQLPTAELNAKFISLKRAKRDIEDTVKELYTNSRFDKQKAEKGIILIDNIEALANSKAQIELIKLIRGSDYKLTSFENSDLAISINTKNVLFVCTINTDVLKNAEKPTNKVGYKLPTLTASNTHASSSSLEEENVVASHKESLANSGIVSELTSLFTTPIILTNNAKTTEKLIPLLTTEILNKYKESHECNFRIAIDNKASAHIKNTALMVKAGVWGLKLIIHKMLQSVMPHVVNSNQSDVIIISYNIGTNEYTTMNTMSIAS
ncbi:AAA family ATPase [Candidatus Hodgkinia cicadicola]